MVRTCFLYARKATCKRKTHEKLLAKEKRTCFAQGILAKEKRTKGILFSHEKGYSCEKSIPYPLKKNAHPKKKRTILFSHECFAREKILVRSIYPLKKNAQKIRKKKTHEYLFTRAFFFCK